jgi:hypothetical protein
VFQLHCTAEESRESRLLQQQLMHFLLLAHDVHVVQWVPREYYFQQLNFAAIQLPACLLIMRCSCKIFQAAGFNKKFCNKNCCIWSAEPLEEEGGFDSLDCVSDLIVSKLGSSLKLAMHKIFRSLSDWRACWAIRERKLRGSWNGSLIETCMLSPDLFLL